MQEVPTPSLETQPAREEMGIIPGLVQPWEPHVGSGMGQGMEGGGQDCCSLLTPTIASL